MQFSVCNPENTHLLLQAPPHQNKVRLPTLPYNNTHVGACSVAQSNCSPLSSSVHGIIPQALLGVACHSLSSMDLPNPGIKPKLFASPALQSYHCTPGEANTVTTLLLKATLLGDFGMWQILYKHFPGIFSLITNPMWYILLFPLFCRWGNWDQRTYLH